MASTKDHEKADAYASARIEIKRRVDSYIRRIYDDATTAIDAEFQRRLAAGKPIDGHEIGTAATLEVLSGYIGAADPQPAIEVAAGPAED